MYWNLETLHCPRTKYITHAKYNTCLLLAYEYNNNHNDHLTFIKNEYCHDLLHSYAESMFSKSDLKKILYHRYHNIYEIRHTCCRVIYIYKRLHDQTRVHVRLSKSIRILLYQCRYIIIYNSIVSSIVMYAFVVCNSIWKKFSPCPIIRYKINVYIYKKNLVYLFKNLNKFQLIILC